MTEQERNIKRWLMNNLDARCDQIPPHLRKEMLVMLCDDFPTLLRHAYMALLSRCIRNGIPLQPGDERVFVEEFVERLLHPEDGLPLFVLGTMNLEANLGADHVDH